jgi:hypothetical protein
MRMMSNSRIWLKGVFALALMAIVVGSQAVFAAVDPPFPRMLPGHGPVRVVIVCSSASDPAIPLPKSPAYPDNWPPTQPFASLPYTIPRFGPSTSLLAPQLQASLSPESSIFPSGSFYRTGPSLPQLPRGGCRPVLVVSR